MYVAHLIFNFDLSSIQSENIDLDKETLNNLTVNKLREVCKKNNLPSTGRKNELQERLKEKLFKPIPNSIKKVNFHSSPIFEEGSNDIAVDEDASFEDEKPTAEVKKQLWQDTEDSDTANEPKAKSSKDFFQSFLSAPYVKKSSRPGPSPAKATRPATAPLNSTPSSKLLGKSPKRKRDSDDAVKTPCSTKKLRPLGFLSSSPRVSSPRATTLPLGNHNRTPVMHKHT